VKALGKKIELTTEQLQRCYKLHAQGATYSKIGQEFHIDRRIIAKTIKVRDQVDRSKGLTDARRDISATYFNEHIKNLELVSRNVLELTIPPQLRHVPLLEAVDLERALFIKFKDLASAKKEKDHAIEEGSLEATRFIDIRMAENEARETIQAHKEHFPSCWQKIRQWEKLAVQYNSAFDELENLSKTIQIPSSSIRSALFTVVKKMEAKDFSSERPIQLTISEPLKQFTLKLTNHRLARRPLLLLIETKSGFDVIFKRLETILSSYQQHRIVLASRCKFCPVP
jgi:hypothetical protein